MSDLKEILIDSNYKKETEELINIANLAYKHWKLIGLDLIQLMFAKRF